MTSEISAISKYIFLLHFIVSLILGAFWFFLPEYWSSLLDWPVEYAAGRIVGMATLMMAVGSIMAYRKTTWDQIEIYVVMELIFNILGAIGMIWNVVTIALPVVTWLIIGLLALFSVLFLYVFFTAKKA